MKNDFFTIGRNKVSLTERKKTALPALALAGLMILTGTLSACGRTETQTQQLQTEQQETTGTEKLPQMQQKESEPAAVFPQESVAVPSSASSKPTQNASEEIYQPIETSETQNPNAVSDMTEPEEPERETPEKESQPAEIQQTVDSSETQHTTAYTESEQTPEETKAAPEETKAAPEETKAAPEETMKIENVDPEKWIENYLVELDLVLQNPDAYAAEPYGFRDRVIIPDSRNTGIDPEITLKTLSESAVIGTISQVDQNAEKRPLFLGVSKAEGNSYYNVNGYANGKCASRVVIEGYNFEDAKFYTTNDQKLPSKLILIFKNCKFGRIQSYPNEHLWLVLDHCQTEGNVSGNNIIMKDCYLHATNSDATNPNRNMILKDCYVKDLLKGSSQRIVHIDGSQTFGDQYGGISENIIFDNVRFSIPQFHIENTETYVNAAISTGLEFSEGRNFMFRNITIDSGGRWYPIYNTGGDRVLFQNIQVANGYDRIFYTGYVNPEATVVNVNSRGGMYVSSVWKDDAGKTHFLCTNHNMLDEKRLRVETDQGEYVFSLDRHPTAAELMDDPAYEQVRFGDLPYDIEFIIEENIEKAVFYDGDQEIRSVDFTKQ